MEKFVLSDAANRLAALLTLVSERQTPIGICVRDSDNVVAQLEPVGTAEGMDTVAYTAARDGFSRLVREVSSGGAPVVITRYKKPLAVLTGIPEEEGLAAPPAPDPGRGRRSVMSGSWC